MNVSERNQYAKVDRFTLFRRYILCVEWHSIGNRIESLARGKLNKYQNHAQNQIEIYIRWEALFHHRPHKDKYGLSHCALQTTDQIHKSMTNRREGQRRNSNETAPKNVVNMLWQMFDYQMVHKHKQNTLLATAKLGVLQTVAIGNRSSSALHWLVHGCFFSPVNICTAEINIARLTI